MKCNLNDENYENKSYVYENNSDSDSDSDTGH